MLFLGSGELEKSITKGELIQAVEEAFILYEGEDFSMPDRMHSEYQGNILLLMPSFNPGGFGTKLVSVFPGNRDRGIPVIQGLTVLNDPETGTPLAILDAAKLTAMRTGAIGAVGVKYLAGPGCRNLGLVGTGVQAWYLLLLSLEVYDFKEVYVTDLDVSRAREFAGKVSSETGRDIRVIESAEELTSRSDVVITATTSMEPVLSDEPELLSGKAFVGIGSFKPDMREFPEGLFPLLDKVYIDSWLSIKESGDLSVSLEKGLLRREQIHSLGSLIMDPVRFPEGSTRFFKSVGMGLFDLVVGQKILQNAMEKGIGLEIEF